MTTNKKQKVHIQGTIFKISPIEGVPYRVILYFNNFSGRYLVSIDISYLDGLHPGDTIDVYATHTGEPDRLGDLEEEPFSNPFSDPLGELDPEDPIYGEIVSVSVCEDLVCVLLHTETGHVPLVLSYEDYWKNGIFPHTLTPGRKMYYERPINFIDLI